MNIKIINKNPEIKYNHNCIGSCNIKKKGIYPHPLITKTLLYINKDDTIPTCPVIPDKNNNASNIYFHDYFKECEHVNYLDDDFLTYIAINDQDFLNRIYGINNYSSAEDFINKKIINLPIYTQQRICNAIYKSFRDDVNFPNKQYVSIIKDILTKNYDIKISNEKISDIIIKSKSDKMPHNIYDLFNKKK